MREQRKNPRFPHRTFAIRIILPGNHILEGRAVEPSAFGATVELSEPDFLFLNCHNDWWSNECPISVSTALNDLPACINNVKETDDKFLVSIKLLDNRSWLSTAPLT